MGEQWDRQFEGMTERTERGFRQDAELAMGADPTRAIVELVTNSDDAYVKSGSNRKGTIRIEVERRRKQPKVITVKDRAAGMTLEEMRTRLGREASRTSGFETNLDVRGLLGRGAKDCAAFGDVKWESWTQDEVATWELRPTGRFHARSRGRTTRDELKSGTVVTLQVEQRFTLKNHNALREALTRHYELRPCLTDRRGREVRLIDVNQNRDDHLVYELPHGRLIEELRIEVPDYPGEFMDVKLYKATENLDDGCEREYWRHGLLIRAGRAAYDVFGGKFEREPWSQYLGWFFGEVEVPGLRRLIRDYDDRLDQGLEPLSTNPIRLVSRNRRGLVRPEEHPFVAAIWKGLEEFLQPHLESLRRELEAAPHTGKLSDETSRRLKELGRVLGRFFEEEEVAAADGPGQGPLVGLQVIPTAQEVEPGGVARFSLRYGTGGRRDSEDAEPVAMMRVVSGPGVVLPDRLELVDRGPYFSRSFLVDGVPEGSMCEVLVEVSGESQTCVLQCVPPMAPHPIEQLQFEHSSYRIRDGGRRSLLLFAPWDLVADESSQLRLTISGDPAVSIEPSQNSFAYDYRRQCGVTTVSIQGRRVGARARISASLGEQIAVAVAEVTGGGFSSEGPRFEFVNEPLPQRAFWDGNVLKISTQDRSISRYLGAASSGWPGQDSVHFRTMLAEIIAFHSVRRVVENKLRGQNVSPLSLYREHLQLERKCIPRIHSVLVGASEVLPGP